MAFTEQLKYSIKNSIIYIGLSCLDMTHVKWKCFFIEARNQLIQKTVSGHPF